MNNSDNNKFWAFIGVFLGIVGFILVVLLQRKNKYAMFYAKQGLVLSIASVIIAFTGSLPLLGRIISLIGSLIILIWWIMGLVYAVSGDKKEIPLIGEFARKIKV